MKTFIRVVRNLRQTKSLNLSNVEILLTRCVEERMTMRSILKEDAGLVLFS